MSSGFGWDILNAMSYAMDRIAHDTKEPKEKKPDDKQKDAEIFELGSDELRQMKWMSPEQLNAIFGHGKRQKAVLKKGDPIMLFNALKWFSEDQLEAIFGEEE